MEVLGKFAVVMADPPWDIHMELPYGTLSDDEMKNLNVPSLQDHGFIFLWVTGRFCAVAIELFEYHLSISNNLVYIQYCICFNAGPSNSDAIASESGGVLT